MADQQRQRNNNNNNQVNQQNPNNQENEPEQQGFRLSMIHYVMIFFATQFIVVQFNSSGNDRNNPHLLHNAFEPDQYFDMKVKIIKNDEVLHSWNVKDLQYNYDEKNYVNKTFTLTEEQIFTEPFPVVAVSLRNQNNSITIDNEGDLVIITEKITKKQLQNLMSSATDDMPQPKQNVTKGEKAPHLRQRFFIQLGHDTNSYHPQQIPPQLKGIIKIDMQNKMYSPVLDVKQFWLRRKDLIYQGQLQDEKKLENESGLVINNDENNNNNNENNDDDNQMITYYNTTIVFYPYWWTKLLMIYQMEEAFKTQSQYGLNDQNSVEQFKEILGDNNPIYLGITFLVSILHSIFELLAVKNDISYWRNLENYQGLSLRSLYTGFGFEVIIFLYLLDSEETSWLIIASSGIELLVTVWKIYKTAKCQRRADNKFPYFEVDQTQKTYVRTTEEYDKTATRYLYYALVPLLIGYTIYSLVYLEHKGWYSFIVSTLVGFIYLFGFINMTPQLYINYKLKSVEHLPWRTMIYKFLNTIVDDLFAFVISMPWLKRLSCFRDDLIFIIYIYQRHIYKVDHKRTQHGFKKEDLVPSNGAPSDGQQQGKEKTD